MSRAKFLKTLRKRLSFLSQSEKEKEILYYINEIDKTNKSDEEIIKSFGTMEDIIKKICDKHHIDYNIVAKKKCFNGLHEFYDVLLTLGSIFKNSDNQKRSKLIIDILFLIIITCIIKIPFIFIRDLGDSFISVFWNNSINFLAIWGLAIEFFYIIVSLSFFINTLKKWVKNLTQL